MLKSVLMLIGVILTIHSIILFHEAGHYFAARIFKIKVKTFTVGLGKTIWQYIDKNDVTWRFGIFPLGGYVVLLNTQLDKVSLSELKQSFNIKPLWQKIVVYLAGPLVNILLAIIIYTGLFLSGMYEVKPNIASIINGSVAYKANIATPSLITSINDNKVSSWRETSIALIDSLGKDSKIKLSTNIDNYELNTSKWGIHTLNFNPIENIGFKAYIPPTPAVVTEIVRDSPADGQLKIGDKILFINNTKITDFSDYEEALKHLANKEIKITISSNDSTKVIPIKTSWTFKDGWNIVGYLGIKPKLTKWPEDKINLRKYNLLGSIGAAIDSTLSMLHFNFIVLGKILTRVIPLASLSGPIGFIGVAFASLNNGITVFLEVVAIFNILIAFANLLPMPGLDGGNIIFRIIEAVKGRAINYLWQELITTFSIIFLVVLTVHATINDLLRLFTN